MKGRNGFAPVAAGVEVRGWGQYVFQPTSGSAHEVLNPPVGFPYLSSMMSITYGNTNDNRSSK